MLVMMKSIKIGTGNLAEIYERHNIVASEGGQRECMFWTWGEIFGAIKIKKRWDNECYAVKIEFD